MKLFGWCLIFIFAFTLTYAQNSQELLQLKLNIHQAEQELSTLSKNKNNILKMLEISEKKVADIVRAQNIIKNELLKNESAIKKISAEIVSKKKKIDTLKKEGRHFTAFIIDGNEITKAYILFNGNSDIIKTLELMEKLNTQAQKTVQTLNSLLIELAEKEAFLLKENDLLQSHKKIKAELFASYSSSKKELATQYNLLKKDASAKKSYIEALQNRERFLEEQIKKTVSKTSVTAQKFKDSVFSKLKGSYDFPMKGTVIQKFGIMIHSATGTPMPHRGIRIKPTGDSSIKSIAAGSVDFIRFANGWQNIIIISHESTYYTIYANIDEFFVKEGDIVKKGDLIGKLESAAYLYFELRRSSEALDPLPWLKK